MISAVLASLGICSLGAFWLGWGRRTTWQAATGWDRLPQTDRERFREGNRAMAKASDSPRLQWLGHSTLLVEWAGVRILFDPVLGRTVSGVPRLFEPSTWPADSVLDAVVLTHAHMDHFHPPSIGRLRAAAMILPRGMERLLGETIREAFPLTLAEASDPLTVGPLEILPLPALHGGWRYPWQKGLKALSYLVRLGERSLYVAGDTAWGEHFASVGKHHAPDYTVLPIGAYAPACLLRKRHMNPEEAVRAALELKSRFVMPCHFGTYRLSMEPWTEPLTRFAAASRGHPFKIFLPIDGLIEAAHLLDDDHP